MRKLIIVTFLLFAAAASSQSVLTLGTGTSMGVSTGANLCVTIINGSGILYGGGGICGGLVAIEAVVSSELPSSFDLIQNYPNPFNPVTVIKYQIPKAAYVSIILYDQLGREAAVLHAGDQQAGYYQATVDGTNLASGIYFCRINAADPSAGSGQSYSKVIKMSLIK